MWQHWLAQPGNDLMPESTLTCNHKGSVDFAWQLFLKECSWTITIVQMLYFWNHYHLLCADVLGYAYFAWINCYIVLNKMPQFPEKFTLFIFPEFILLLSIQLKQICL